MRQELKNLRLAVDREEERPFKPPKARWGPGWDRRGHASGEARNTGQSPMRFFPTRKKTRRKLGRRRKRI